MKELIQLLHEFGIPFAYDHFAEGESPDPPFICYLLPGSDNFAADGRVYFKVDEVHIELYTDEKSPATEQALETVLDNHGIYMIDLKHGLTAKSCMRSFIALKWR